MAVRSRASFTGLAIVLRRESLLPWKEPAQSNDWHFIVPASDLFTSEVTRSEEQALAADHGYRNYARENLLDHRENSAITRKGSATHLGVHRIDVNAAP